MSDSKGESFLLWAGALRVVVIVCVYEKRDILFEMVSEAVALH